MEQYNSISVIICVSVGFVPGVYYCLNMILITLSSFLNVIVVNLSFYGARGPMPKILKKVSKDIRKQM